MHAHSFRRLRKQAERGFRGDPIGTVAFYGPTNELASKVVAAVSVQAGHSADILGTWFSERGDIRSSEAVGVAVRDALAQRGVRSVVMTRGIIGCPHEEGIDYPHGEPCPKCPFWRNRERWKEA